MGTVTRGFVVLGVLILVIVVFCVGFSFFWLPGWGQGVGLPVITLPAEVLAPMPNLPFDFTNTMTSTLLVDAILLLIGFAVMRATSGVAPDKFVPRGLTNFIDVIVEFLYNQAHSLLGPNTRKVFPIAATIFLMLLVGNWVKLVPGVESVGIIACAEKNQPGYRLSGADDGVPGMWLFNGDNNGDGAFVLGERAGHKTTLDEAHACEDHPKYGEKYVAPGVIAKELRGKGTTTEQKPAEEGAPVNEGAPAEGTAPVQPSTQHRVVETSDSSTTLAEGADPNYFVVIPFFRALATDLNLPLALSIVVVLMVQFWGVSALGPAYFFKFVNVPALGEMVGGNGKAAQPMKGIDFVVGLIEIISELSRIISLTFRLFGNIFAGGVLVVVLSFLIAFLLPVPFYFLEIFVGAIQAYVFAMLTFIYAGQAMTAHHSDDEHGHADQDHH